ncbi:hypothetical protein TNCV_3753851 [Trichonephila clavipes]|nr:hypothetical protein TNCV_3753851 [Trichonephila clavipes]
MFDQKRKQGIDKNVGASRFNALYDRQGCILTRTVESNQGGRFDGRSVSVEDDECAECPSSAITDQNISDMSRFPLTTGVKLLINTTTLKY